MDINFYEQFLEDRKKQNNLRKFKLYDKNVEANFSTNDYLSLCENKKLKEDFLKTNESFLGATSSRLLAGNSKEALLLEQSLKEAYNKEALLYNSTYHLNLGVLCALSQKKDLIIADKLVHASILDGIKLSAATFKRYAHLNYEHLEAILQKEHSKYNKIFIVSETLFSMDGDLVNLHKLIELKKKYNTFLYLDEAHAVGVYGKKGLGLTEQEGLLKEVDFLVGAFGKSFASVGGYLICNKIIKDFLINTSRTLIYTTALPPINLAWSNYIFKFQQGLQKERQELLKKAYFLQKEFQFNEINESPIISYILPDNKKVTELSKYLNEKKYRVLPVKYPTVPKGTSRLRFSLTVSLSYNILKQVAKEINGYLLDKKRE